MAERFTNNVDTQVTSVVLYPYYIVFDLDTLFMLDHFKDREVTKGIKLNQSTAYHTQTTT